MQSPALTWTGRILTVLPLLALLPSAALKISSSAETVEGFGKYGYEPNVIVPIGVFELVCAALFAIPQTAVFGATLLTAYLGGAAATHVAAGEGPTAPIVVAVLAWTAIGLRDPRLRALLPIVRR